MRLLSFVCVILAGIGMLSLTGCGGDSSSTTQKRVAFIYNVDTTTAAQFATFFKNNNLHMDAIQMEKITETDFTPYSLLITANDTGLSWTATEAQGLKDSGLPIIAMPFSVDLYDDPAFDVKFGQNKCVDLNGTAIVVDNNAESLNFFEGISGVVAGSTVQITNTNLGGKGVAIATVANGVMLVGYVSGDPSYSPLAIKDRYGLWGFVPTPDKLTADGRTVLMNFVNYQLAY